jgi:hypothetical protein
MRSYYAHLETTAPQSSGPIAPKPVFRSSAIFPAFKRKAISTRLLFLGYWMLKRSIQQLSAVVSLRLSDGRLLARSNMTIDKAKCYRIELDDLLHQCNWPFEQLFDGSIEIEFYSAVGLVFPYPAVVVNYYGPQFSSVVHTAQRTYNDYDDMIKNSETSVPESGFNIFADEFREPFIGLINGPINIDSGTIDFEFLNHGGDLLAYHSNLGRIAPYEALALFPDREVDLREFLGGQAGFCRTRFNVKGIFPRLLIGNWLRNEEGISVTHTYYDCSSAISETDYWTPSNSDYYPASLMVPVSCIGKHFTNITFYPIYSPSEIEIGVEFYGQKGNLLGTAKHATVIKSPGNQIVHLPLKQILDELGISRKELLAARIIPYTLGKSRMPARVKLGLDLGIAESNMPCNICTNLQPYNPKFDGKGRSFKWAPILADQKEAKLWLMNSTPKHTLMEEASLEVTFFREKDEEQLKRTLTLPPQGFYCIDLISDKELQGFFDGAIGWCTVVTNNPYLTTYYFTESPQGAVGGDHGF